MCNGFGGPGNIYWWQVNGTDISGENSSILIISNIEASDGGIYSCVVSNGAGEESAETFVYVYPYFVSQPSDQQTSNGSTVVFNCDAEGFPSPDVLWQRVDGKSIRDEIVVTRKVLNISSVHYGDEGEYYCTAVELGIMIQSRQTLITGICKQNTLL